MTALKTDHASFQRDCANVHYHLREAMRQCELFMKNGESDTLRWLLVERDLEWAKWRLDRWQRRDVQKSRSKR